LQLSLFGFAFLASRFFVEIGMKAISA
jgi:hypothetical protein